MPNWNTLNDPFNITFDTNQFNPFGLQKITQEICDMYLPHGNRCSTCPAIFDDGSWMPVCYTDGTCKLRPKDTTPYGRRHIVTRGLGKPPSLMILSGTMVWNVKYNLDFIFRASRENGIEMHHNNFNPHDNRVINISMLDQHSSLHGELKSLKTSINKLTNVAARNPYDKALTQTIQSLQRIYSNKCKSVKDCSKVFDIIDVINQVRAGIYSIPFGQEKLERMNAALPVEVLQEKGLWDLRKFHSNQKKHLKKYIKRMNGGPKSAVQNIQHMVV